MYTGGEIDIIQEIRERLRFCGNGWGRKRAGILRKNRKDKSGKKSRGKGEKFVEISNFMTSVQKNMTNYGKLIKCLNHLFLWIMWISWCITHISHKINLFIVDNFLQGCAQKNVDTVDKWNTCPVLVQFAQFTIIFFSKCKET